MVASLPLLPAPPDCNSSFLFFSYQQASRQALEISLLVYQVVLVSQLIMSGRLAIRTSCLFPPAQIFPALMVFQSFLGWQLLQVTLNQSAFLLLTQNIWTDHSFDVFLNLLLKPKRCTKLGNEPQDRDEIIDIAGSKVCLMPCQIASSVADFYMFLHP